MVRSFIPWDVPVRLPNPGHPPGPVIPPDERTVLATLPMALNDRHDSASVESVLLPAQVQAFLNEELVHRTDGDALARTIEDQAARAAARAVEQTWATAITALRGLYADVVDDAHGTAQRPTRGAGS